MGVRSILRAAQQSLPKRISSIFSSDFVGSSIVGDVVTVASRRKWSFLRGTWGVSSSKLTTSSASSSYPITVVDALVPDVKIELKDIGQGVGAALWVTDSGNWWAVATEQQSEQCNCSTTSFSCNCGTCQGSFCSSYSCSCGNSNYSQYCVNETVCEYQDCQVQYGNFCSARYANGNCKEYTKISWTDCFCVFYTTQTNCYSSNYYSGTFNCCCSATYYYPCGCSTCYSTSCETCYPQYMRIIQSAANTVSEIVKWQVSNIVKSLRVLTSNKNITVKSYSDTDLATEIDSTDYNASSASETTKFGIVVSPSGYNESKTVSEINIERGV